MKHIHHRFYLMLLCLAFIACKEDEQFIQEDQLLVNTLQETIHPLNEDPLAWTDAELASLDLLASKDIVGLGEATHGTAEFFKAKFRIFKYMVENHNFKVFAIEADYGESWYINKLIWNGNKSAIRTEMEDKMHFWTWKTTEVQQLLEWMAEYNTNVSSDERLLYVGVDCQSNRYNPTLVKDYLSATAPDLFALEIESLTDDSPSIVIESIIAKMEEHKDQLTIASNEDEYEWHLRAARIALQVIEVKAADTYEVRDFNMAENLSWLKDFTREKMVYWAHNAHVSNRAEFTGAVLSRPYLLEGNPSITYGNVGFIFSEGHFTGRQAIGESSSEVKRLALDRINRPMSINAIFQEINTPLFTLRINSLLGINSPWLEYLGSNKSVYFEVGAVLSDDLNNHFRGLNADTFDYIIYIEKSTATDYFGF